MWTRPGLIVDLLNSWGEVNLFTRPRRFGKTLNMSMFKSFFRDRRRTRRIFDGLADGAGQRRCATEYMGKYPVVFISLKGVDGTERLKRRMSALRNCSYVRRMLRACKFAAGQQRRSAEVRQVA